MVVRTLLLAPHEVDVVLSVPLLPTILLGASFSLVFISLLSYLVDVYLLHAASALAANTILRSALAAAFPLYVHSF